MSIKFNDSGRVGLKMKVVTLAAALTLTGVAVFAPLAAMADMTTQQTIDQLTAQIAALSAQLTALSGKPAATTMTSSGGACSITRNLTVGVRGDDVKCLQTQLNISPASGYFGPLTKAAVVKWQQDAGISPASGYFGPISRAKYSSMVMTVPPTTFPPPTTTPPTTTTPPVVVAGSGLTVTAPIDQPASQLAPGNAARVAFVKAILTASSDGDVTVNSITAERRGPSADADFDSIILLDENGTQIGNSRTLSSDHKVNLNQSFMVKAGTSKVVTIAGNIVASPNSGEIAKLAITAVDAGTSKVNANLPIEGNGMTFNSTLTIGSVTMTIGALDPGAANTKNVGTQGYYFAAVKASVGSAEDVLIQSVRFNQAGSVAASDLANVMVNVSGKDYPTTVSADGKYYVASLGDGIMVAKGNNVDFSIKGDIVNGSGRTVDFDILRKTDVVVKGKTFGYNIVVTGGSAGTASAGGFSSNNEPFFNAYAATISKGSVLISSSNTVPSGNVPNAVSDTPLGAFTFDVKGEPVQFSSIVLNFNFSGTGTSSNVTSVKLVDSNGNIAAGPKDPSSGIVTWTDTWTAPVGVNTYKVLGKLSSTFATNDTVKVGVNPDNMTVKGVVTGLSISGAPASTFVTANAQTVKAAAVTISVSSPPFAQNVVLGVNQFLFANYVFDATQSGEDVRLTSIQLRDTLDANASGSQVNTCTLYDNATANLTSTPPVYGTALNTGSDVVNPGAGTALVNDITFTLTTNLIIPKNGIKKLDLRCNIASSATANSTHSWGTNAAAANVGATGASTGSSVSKTINTSAGSMMTVLTAGTFTVVQDASAPVASIVLSGRTNVPMNVLKYHATNEAINITDLTLTFSSSTASTSDFLKATAWDGAVKLGDAVWTSGALNATTTFSVPFVVPKDQDKLLTITADLGNIDSIASSTAGRLLAIDYNGISSSSGIGQASGVRLGSSSGNNTGGSAMQIMKTVPTLAKVSVPTTSLPQSQAILYRFSVAADPAGPVALYKFTFNISSSTVNASSSNFNLYGYSDSGFSQAAYATNPLHLAPIRCVSYSTLNNPASGTSCATQVGANLMASTSDISFFFAPQANIASTTEAIVVSGTRYFELRGDITLSGAGTGNSVRVALKGDTARPVRNSNANGAQFMFGASVGSFGDSGRSRLAIAAEAASQSASNAFIWSPMSTTTSLTGATSTPDWTNGFKVPGLPSTNMDANTFTN